MSDGKMQELIDKIRKQYPTLTNKKGDLGSYVYIVKNREILIAVERTNSDAEYALTGDVTDLKHSKSGISMMASAYNRTRNNIYYIPSTKTKGAEIERELKQIEKNIKTIVLGHYGISNKKAGDLYCSGTIKNKEVANLLKRFLYEGLSPDARRELNEPMFSFTELLEMVNEDGEAWHNIIHNKKSALLACKLLGVSPKQLPE
ncbi:MAG: hypothetical protein BM556_05840 [Bacteriovorax sp. MedPE-SWde]|nr:MAG: hypothetical protein BM556_05840 [Bacteriovorax sp. MedPE-SWde]